MKAYEFGDKTNLLSCCCRQHFADPDIIRNDLQHEELLVCYPPKWVSNVENCCGILTG